MTFECPDEVEDQRVVTKSRKLLCNHQIDDTWFGKLFYSTVFLSLSEIIFMDSRIKYWADLSDYDLETANAMLVSKRYLYVGFMCHQSIEKIFKALYVKLKNETPPFSHSLSYLSRNGEFFELLTEADKSLSTYWSL